MNNKYYTPSIEEFHIGFEYETKFGLNSPFTIRIVHPGYKFTQIQKDIDAGYIKVKYLDKEDIEDLGFINWTVEWSDPARYYFTKSLPDGSESIKKGIQLFFIFGSYNRDHVLIYNIIDTVDHILFDGVIKNKSELKTLLNQLNIQR